MIASVLLLISVVCNLIMVGRLKRLEADVQDLKKKSYNGDQ